MEVKKYLKEGMQEPQEQYLRYKEALYSYRVLLDSIGMKMPISKIPYDHKDKETHKFLSVVLSGKRLNGKKFVKDILNPHCKYRKHG